jgi:branched-subunit amino acid aminotransferase/4-amino-4-deoxychorismate lyase
VTVHLAWLDGARLAGDAAALPPSDLGLRLGLGVFETFRVEAQRVAGLDAHLARLAAGGARLGIAVDSDRVRAGLATLVAATGPAPAVARVTVTAGDAAPGWPPEPEGRPRTLVTLAPAPPLPTPDADAALVAGPRAPAGLADVKTISYAGSVVATRRARARGATVALVVEDGEVREAADGNVLVVRGDLLATPPADGRILPGVTRELVLALAPDLGLGVSETALHPEDLLAADLVVVSSAVRGLRRLRRIDGVGIGSSSPHPALARLRAGLAELVAAAAPVTAGGA